MSAQPDRIVTAPRDAIRQRLTDATTVAACLADTAAACIVLADGAVPPVVHLRRELAALTPGIGAVDLPLIATGDGRLAAIADATTDSRVSRHPWVVGKPHFRFLAAVALAGPDGTVLGWLHLFDTRHRLLNDETRAAIEAFASQTGTTLADTAATPPRKAPETRSHMTEQTLRQLIRHVPVALAMFDREMRYLEASDAWAKAFGMGETSEIGRSHYELFPDVPERYRASHQRSLRGEVFRVDEDHWVNRDGTSGWYRWEQRPWYAADGTIGGIILFAEEITGTRVSAAILRMLSVEATDLSFSAFLRMCVIRLADILELDRVHIAQPCAIRPGSAQTLALCVDGAEMDNVRYSLDGTPCEATLANGSSFYPANVQAHFPDDHDMREMGYESYVGLALQSREGEVLGLLAGISRKPLVNAEQVLDAMRVAALGIGAALERHHASEAINGNVQFNHALLNALTSQIAVLDDTGQIIFTNHSWDERKAMIACVPCHGETGNNLVEHCEAVAEIKPEAAQIATRLRRVLGGQLRQDVFEFPVVAGGTKHWFKCTIKRFSGPASPYVLVAQEEITEFKQAQRRTDRVQQQFRHLFESAPDAIFMVDHSGRIRLANRKAAQMFGYSSEALANRPVEVLIDAHSRRWHVGLRRQFFGSARAAAMGDSRSALKGRRRDGTLFPIEISLSRFSSSGEEDDEYVIAVVRDLTMRLQAQADRVAREVAEAANEAKSIFLATMSHEIRTPLSAVLGLAEVMSRGALSHEQLRLLGSMRDSAGHLLRLIDDVLDFSKIEAGSLEIEQAPVDLCELVESTVLGLADHAMARNVALHLFVAPELPTRIMADDVRLRQVIYNLLGNAIKFSTGSAGKPGHVSLRAERVGAQDESAGKLFLQLVVTDDGIGMAPETLEKLFQPFTQGEGTTTRKFGGTGLGLAICKRIIDRIGGEITVQSQPDRGARFTVRLPLEVPPDERGTAPGKLAGLVCLICESAAYDRDDLCRYLEHDGATVLLPGPEDIDIMAQSASDGCVLIIGANDAPPTGITHSLPRVMIGGNGAHRLANRARNHIFLDSRAMLRGDLARAVALALGRDAIAAGVLREMEGRQSAPLFADNNGGGAILVAEDDLLNQSVILRQLELLGLRATIANDGAEALEKWRSGSYALLLTDLHMPNMDGYALTVAIRSDEAQTEGARRMPILALTANALRDEANRARRIGMDDYLTKPISLAGLAEALRPWFPALRADDPPVAPPAPQSVIDLSAHADLIGDDAATIHAFLTTYHEISRDLVADFDTAVASGAHAEAAMILHRLKSASRWLGAKGFGDLCETLEAAAKAGDGAQLAARLAEFNALHARVITETEQICREGSDQA